MNLRHLYTLRDPGSSGTRGRKSDTAGMHEVACLYCLKDGGVLGGRPNEPTDDPEGQITFFAEEVFAGLCKHLGIRNRAPASLRRNVVTSGVEWSELIGREFEIHGVRFLGTGECRASDWMNQDFGDGAQAFLAGRGGLRARILTDGWLRPGPSELLVWPAEDAR